MEREEFTRQLNELWDIMVFGIACFSAWYGIADLDEDSADALNRYRGFFFPAQRSFREVALLQFSKMFDRHRKTVSLPNLLSAAKANPHELVPHAREEDLQNLDERIHSNRKLLERLKNYRDQRLAHHDQKVTKDTSLPYDEVTQLVEEMKDMFNCLSDWHSGAAWSFEGMLRISQYHVSEVKRLVCEERDRVKCLEC